MDAADRDGAGAADRQDLPFEPRELALPHGATLVVRAVAPEDVDGLAALYEGLDLDDRYRRFFCVYRPARSFFEKMANTVDYGGFGLVAVATPRAGDDGSIVAEASYSLLPDGDGELAVTVARAWRGWLGPYLLDALLGAAAARGIPNLQADVLVSNGPMLALLRARGYATTDHPDWTIVRIAIGTAGCTPAWPDRHARPRVLVEAPGARWRAEAEARALGMLVLACPGPAGRRPPCAALSGQPCPLAAGADVIVMSHPPETEPWRLLPEAHCLLHGSVPVAFDHGPAAEGTPGIAIPEGDAAATAAFVVDIAREHWERTETDPAGAN